MVQKSNSKAVSNLPGYIFRAHTLMLLGSFFIYFVELLQLFEWGRVKIVSMCGFLETDTREQQKYKKGIQAYVDNTANVENCVKDKNNIFIK